MHGWKLMLTALGTGALLGTIGGTTINPAMKPPPEQPWRQGFGPQHTPTPTYEIVDSGPQDLRPEGFTYGAPRAFSEDRHDAGRRALAYRFDDEIPQPEADADWSYAAAGEEIPVRPGLAAPVPVEVPAIEAAEAARDAALDAEAAGAVVTLPDQPSI